MKQTTDKRKPGQSQLDYLWSNYGQYSVSDVLEADTIPTSGLLQNLVDKLSSGTVESLKVVNGVLVGININNEQTFSLDISEITNNGRTITNFGRRYITSSDVDNGCSYPINTPVYYIKFSDDAEFIAQIDSYEGYETNSIVITINNGQVSGKLKINNEDSVVTLEESKKGVKADLKISKAEEGEITLSKELDGLKAKINLDGNRSLKFKMLPLNEYLYLTEKDETTVYFIEGKNYFYFGENLIGSVNLDEYFTKDEMNDIKSELEKYIDDSLSDVGINWNFI